MWLYLFIYSGNSAQITIKKQSKTMSKLTEAEIKKYNAFSGYNPLMMQKGAYMICAPELAFAVYGKEKEDGKGNYLNGFRFCYINGDDTRAVELSINFGLLPKFTRILGEVEQPTALYDNRRFAGRNFDALTKLGAWGIYKIEEFVSGTVITFSGKEFAGVSSPCLVKVSDFPDNVEKIELDGKKYDVKKLRALFDELHN